MQTLELTVFDHGPVQIENLKKRLEQFKKQHKIEVSLEVLPWDGSWSRMVQVALYKDGPDVSELGSTWLGDFVHMNALRPFSSKEIWSFGGEDAFLKPCWSSAGIWSNSSNPELTHWGVPWLADVRILAYRRDVYEKAGIDLETAFSNLDTVDRTFSQLQDAGVAMPLTIPTLRSRIDFHILAAWVWGEGGDFLHQQKNKITFDSPEAIRGFCRYFSLFNYLAERARSLHEVESNNLFYSGEAATTLGGQWLLQVENLPIESLDNVGVVGIPPRAFVGGSHFVIWRHSRKEEAALKLINFLAGSNTPPEFYPGFGFPARLDAIEGAEFYDDERNAAMVQAAINGKSFPTGRLWGMIEKRLVDLIPVIWRDIFASEKPDVEAIVTHPIKKLANRLRTALET
jgi:multiple sugar transport system substrate-binding protein